MRLGSRATAWSRPRGGAARWRRGAAWPRRSCLVRVRVRVRVRIRFRVRVRVRVRALGLTLSLTLP